MKVLLIDDSEKYLYPENVNDLQGFIEYIRTSEERFIEMDRLDDESSMDPYYIKECIYKVFINFDVVESITESDADILSLPEYDSLMLPLIDELCGSCENEGDPEMGCDCPENKRDKIDIAAKTCWEYESGDEDPDPDPAEKLIFINKGRHGSN